MELLDRARSLLDNLKKTSKKLEQIQYELENAGPDELEQLYGEEFEVAMEMSDIFETLMLFLDKMGENEDTSFIANRLKTQAESIIGGYQTYDL